MISIRGIIDKVASRTLAVTAAAGAAAATGAVEITWPIAAIALAYILGQAAAAGTVVEVAITAAQLVLVIAVVNRLLEVAERIQRIFVIEG